MKIEEVTPQIAALYLGQKFEDCDGLCYTLSNMDVRNFGKEVPGWRKLVLHLRRLESITEEEAIHIHNDVIGFEYSGIIPCRDWIYLGFDGESCFYNDAKGYPQVWLYLLSKGFDLFGLIDVGLAKEITTQTNEL